MHLYRSSRVRGCRRQRRAMAGQRGLLRAPEVREMLRLGLTREPPDSVRRTSATSVLESLRKDTRDIKSKSRDARFLNHRGAAASASRLSCDGHRRTSGWRCLTALRTRIPLLGVRVTSYPPGSPLKPPSWPPLPPGKRKPLPGCSNEDQTRNLSPARDAALARAEPSSQEVTLCAVGDAVCPATRHALVAELLREQRSLPANDSAESVNDAPSQVQRKT